MVFLLCLGGGGLRGCGLVVVCELLVPSRDPLHVLISRPLCPQACCARKGGMRRMTGSFFSHLVSDCLVKLCLVFMASQVEFHGDAHATCCSERFLPLQPMEGE